MGQDEMPGLEAHQLGAVSPVRGPLTETQKTLARKRQELDRVLELLRSPQLSHGMARELRKHVAILDREIVELEQV